MTEYIYAIDGQQGHWFTGEEIVRCRDCRYYYEAEDYHPQGNVTRLCCEYFCSYGDEVSPDGFCAWAERKEVGE